MEFELGLKMTKVIDDFVFAELLIAKDRAGPLFLSKETNNMFILNAHLKGYRRENIRIDINNDGTRITISGEKPVKEMVMEGWKVIKNEIDRRGFTKVFKIPNGVDLDKIKGKFDEEESFLTISMPKLVEGVMIGGEIEELKEEEVASEGSSETMQIVPSGVADKEKTSQKESGKMVAYPEEIQGEKAQDLQEQVKESQGEEITQQKTGLKKHDCGIENAESIKSVSDQVIRQTELPLVVAEHTSDEIPRAERKMEGEELGKEKSAPDQVIRPTELPSVEGAESVGEHTSDEIPRVGEEVQGKESEKKETSQGIEGVREPKGNEELDQTKTSLLKQPIGKDQHDKDHGNEEIQGRKGEIQEKGNDVVKPPEQPSDIESGIEKEKSTSDGSNQKENPPPKSSNLCVPIVAGSAFLVSLIAIVFHLFRNQNNTNDIRAKKQ